MNPIVAEHDNLPAYIYCNNTAADSSTYHPPHLPPPSSWIRLGMHYG